MPVGTKSFWNDELQVASTRAFRAAAQGVAQRIESTKPSSIPVRGPYYGSQLAGAARGVRTGAAPWRW